MVLLAQALRIPYIPLVSLSKISPSKIIPVLVILFLFWGWYNAQQPSKEKAHPVNFNREELSAEEWKQYAKNYLAPISIREDIRNACWNEKEEWFDSTKPVWTNLSPKEQK